jgi:hypothetical protein
MSGGAAPRAMIGKLYSFAIGNFVFILDDVCTFSHFLFAGLRFRADDGPTLPVSSNEEFRPFMRRLPEFKFWSVKFLLYLL